MHYRSLLFSGVFITAIASLLVVQSCTKYDQADNERNRAGNERNRVGNESDRAGTERDRVGNERDRAGTESDLELGAATTRAMSYLQGLLAIGRKIKERGYYLPQEKLDYEQFLQDKLIIKNLCVAKNNRDACSTLESLRGSEGSIENILQMHELIGK